MCVPSENQRSHPTGVSCLPPLILFSASDCMKQPEAFYLRLSGASSMEYSGRMKNFHFF